MAGHSATMANDDHIFEKFQSGFCSHHRTDTALVKGSNYMLLTADSKQFIDLILLDLSSAFDI